MDNSTRNHITDIYHDVFHSPGGIAVLDDLYIRFHDPATKFPLDALSLAYQAGQRDVVRTISIMRDRKVREAEQLKENDDE